ncbi:hypothetical protein BJ981_003870 [Sphaerisporangium krabiense]|uniref:Uncharacterized protein n=1 Tax=Sphaerisporangium krabiense TaxID=763782 RepID=A0A7W8Z626_9ACTN|nr:hypothetical protein [Sphaerisporangium krabiense]
MGVLLGALSVASAQCPPVLAASRPVPDFSPRVSPTRLLVPAGMTSVAQCRSTGTVNLPGISRASAFAAAEKR